MKWPWQSGVEPWEHERELYYRLADVVFVLNIEGKIIGIIKSNPRHPVPESMKGKYLRELLGPDQGLKGAQAMREALSSDRRVVFEYTLRQGEPLRGTLPPQPGAVPGHEIYYFRSHLVPLPRQKRGREERVLWLSYDATDRKLHESSLWMRNELLEGVLNARISLMGEVANSEAAAAKNPEKTTEGAAGLDEVLKILGRATKADRAYILEHYQTPYYQVLSLQREWCANPALCQLGNPHMEQIEYEDLLPGWLPGILKSGYKWFNLDELPEKFRAVLRVTDIQWILALPVFREQMLWGVLCLEFHRSHREWVTEEIRILQAMTETIGGWVRHQETQKDLQIAQIEAEKANKAKSEFLAVISHELRTPMNAILGYSQLLMSTIKDKEQKEQLGFIERSGRTLMELINNILDFSKIESRGVELEVIPFALEQVVVETLETCSIRAKEKGVSLDYKLDKDMPRQLLGDPHRIKQILLNLVNNAVKFTPKGSVSVEISQSRADNKVFLRCSVRDTGIGIEPSKASKLFRAFTQADSSTTRQYGGTGLGLAIAKRLVESMGGKIWVESAVGQGSVFHFTLQVLAAAVVRSKEPFEQKPAEVAAPKPAEEIRGLINNELDMTFGARFPMSILLVEDDPMNQRLALKLLDKLGYDHVAVAFDGMDGLKRVNEGSYDLILADLQMPRLDGIGMTRRLRMGECGSSKKRIPVVAVTAYAMSEDKDRCLQAGMNDFIRKPIQVSELKEALITAYHQKLR